MPALIINDTEDVNATGGDISLAEPASLVVDELLLAALVNNDASAATPANITGFTSVTTVAGGTITKRVTQRVADGSEGPTYTSTVAEPTAFTLGKLLRIIGADTTTPIDGFNSATGTSSSFALPAVTTSTAGCLAVALVESGAGSNTAIPSGWFLYDRYDTDAHAVYMRWMGASGQSTGTSTVTLTGSAIYVATVVTLAPEDVVWPMIAGVLTQFGTSLSGAANLAAFAAPQRAQATGDLVLHLVGSDNPSTTDITASTGWSVLSHQVQGSNVIKGCVLARVLDGGANDTCNPAGAAQDYGVISVIIPTGEHGVTNPATDIFIGNTTGASGNADPPSLDTGASDDYLVLACAVVDATTGNRITAQPSGLGPITEIVSASSTSSVMVGMAALPSTGQTFNPGAFANPSRAWIAWTVAIPPASVSTSLVVADFSAASTFDALTLGQDHTLTVADFASGSSFDAIGLVSESDSPTSVTAIPGDDCALVEWITPADNGGSAITGYKIERNVNAAGWTTLVSNTGDTYVWHLDDTLTNGQAVQYRVSAINAKGTSAASSPSSSVTAIERLFPAVVNSGGRWIEDQNGDPWPLLGDAGGLWPHLAADAVVTDYLDELVDRGYNAWRNKVYEAGEIAGIPELIEDVNGNEPFTGTAAVSGLVAAYWKRTEWCIAHARVRGITVFLTPLWWGVGTEGVSAQISASTDAAVRQVGEDIGLIFVSYPNIVWVLGGDAVPTATLEDRTDAFAAGLVTDAGCTQLMTFHPIFEEISSNEWIPTWLDINSMYDRTPASFTLLGDAWADNAGPIIELEPDYQPENDWTRAAGRHYMYGLFCGGSNGTITGNSPRYHWGLYDAFFGGGTDYAGSWSATGTVDTEAFNTFVAGLDVPWEGTLRDTTGTFMTAGTGTSRFSTACGLVWASAASSITLDTTEMLGTTQVRIRRFDPGTGALSATVAASEAQSSARSISHPGNNSIGASDWVYIVDITSNATLVVADFASASTFDNVALTQDHTLVVADATGASTFDALTLTQDHILVVADVAGSSVFDALALTQDHVLTVNDMSTASTLDAVALTQDHILVIADLTVASTIDNVTITQHHVLTVADSAGATAWDTVALTQHQALTVADSTGASTFDGVTLTQHQTLAIADMSAGSTFDNVSLTQHHVLVVADFTGATTWDSVVLGTAGTLGVVDFTAASTFDTLTLAQAHDLVVADLASVSLFDTLTLLQHHALVVAELTSASTLDGVALGQHHVLGVVDMAVAALFDNVTLAVQGSLGIADFTSGSTFDTVVILQDHLLVVADSTVGSSLDNVVLQQTASLSVTDMSVTALLDTLALGQAHALTVADFTVASLFDTVVFVIAALTTLRMYCIQGESRTYCIAGENRTLIVEAP